MRILVAPDGFGGTLTAVEAAEAIAAGWRAAAPRDVLDLAPMSDGGPGFVDVLAAALPTATVLQVTVEDPVARSVQARLLLAGATAYVESAEAAGLHLLAESERDPLVTTSYGVGQLLRAALDAGATRIVVGLGGSATNDGGAGLLAALGVQRVDAAGQRLAPGGAALLEVAALTGELDPRLAEVTLVVATDVDAPLLGLTGASAVFGPQKGASPNDVQVLDAALTRWADLLEAHLSVAVRDLPGAGAAGGLGAALLAVGADREPGTAWVQRLARVEPRMAKADLVVTGEGTLDFSSLRGKVVSGIASAAARAGLPCLVLAGQVSLGRRETAAAGIDATYAVADAVGVEASLARPAEELSALAERVAREWSRGG
ncbi:MAG: glycerate kinase [Mycobacteriales bacterium]